MATQTSTPTHPVAKGMARIMLADLALLLALALGFINIEAPPQTTTDWIPDPIEPPIENRPGDRPAAGQAVARATFDVASGKVQIQYKGRGWSIEEFQSELGESTVSDFPDHIVFRFESFEKFQALARMALANDAAVSLEMKP